MCGAGTIRRRTAVGLALALIATVTAYAPVAARAQIAGISTPLPGSMSSMIVDPATELVFVSLGDTDKVVVLDFDGQIVKTISGEPGASGLALVGHYLYVVTADNGGIDEIDTTTLTRTRTLASGMPGITDIASAGGALWVVPGFGGSLKRVARSDGSIKTYTNPVSIDDFGLASDPADSGSLILYTSENGLTIARLDATTDPPTLLVSNTVTLGGARDIAISPDGTRLVPATGAPYEFDEFRMSDLKPTGVVYPVGAYPVAVAMTAGGGGLFAGGLESSFSHDIFVYQTGDPSAPLLTHDFHLPGQSVRPGGLAFTPDGSRLFAVTGDIAAGEAYDTFQVLAAAAPFIQLSTTALEFGDQRVGTYGGGEVVTITNSGNAPARISDITLSGANPVDFFGSTDCFHSGNPGFLAARSSCHVTMYFGALKLGARAAELVVQDDAMRSPHTIPLSGSGTEGYYVAGSLGEVGAFGDAVHFGDMTRFHLNSPMISLATTPNGDGYWLLARDGGIFSFGNANFYGSTGAIHLNKPIVGMTPTRTGRGYWLVASDGGIFSFGDARFYGSTGAIRLNRPVVGMAATPTGHGYWLVASDGGIFSFGDARFYGSTGNLHLVRPITSMTTTASGRGYMFVANDGGVFTFGDAQFSGSASGTRATIVGIASTPAGRGYWLASNTGQIFHYGDAPFFGDIVDLGITDVIGIASPAPPLPPELLDSSARPAYSGSIGTGSVDAGSSLRRGGSTDSGRARRA